MSYRLVVFASDNGTKLKAVLDACTDGALGAQVVALVTDKKSPAVHVAEAAGIPIIFHPWGPYKVAGKLPETYQRDLAVKVWMYQPDLIVIAGWARGLLTAFLEHFPLQVVATQVALHATFSGPFALAHAFDAFQRGEISGTWITAYYPTGGEVQEDNVISTEPVAMISGEPFEEFEGRLMDIESRHLVEAVRRCLALIELDPETD